MKKGDFQAFVGTWRMSRRKGYTVQCRSITTCNEVGTVDKAAGFKGSMAALDNLDKFCSPVSQFWVRIIIIGCF